MNRIIKCLPVIALMSAFQFSMGQTIVRSVISNGGLSNRDANVQMSATIGEPVTEVFHDDQIWLKQGFEQPLSNIIVSASWDQLTAAGVLVYPVPTMDILNIRFEHATDLQPGYSVFDMSGKTMSEGNLLSLENQLDVSAYAAGMYCLLIHLIQGTPAVTIKFQKIN